MNKKILLVIIIAVLILGIVFVMPVVHTLNKGKGVYEESKAVINNAGDKMNELLIESFNGQFTPYEGKNVKGSKINTLMDYVIMSNSNNNEYKVKLIIDEPNIIIDENNNNGGFKVPVSNSYEVKVNYDSDSKLVNEIIVTKIN